MHTIHNRQSVRPSGDAVLLHYNGSFPASELCRGLLDRIAAWFERSRQRRALAGLDERMLRDIGVSRADAIREAGKPFWRP